MELFSDAHFSSILSLCHRHSLFHFHSSRYMCLLFSLNIHLLPFYHLFRTSYPPVAVINCISVYFFIQFKIFNTNMFEESENNLENSTPQEDYNPDSEQRADEHLGSTSTSYTSTVSHRSHRDNPFLDTQSQSHQADADSSNIRSTSYSFAFNSFKSSESSTSTRQKTTCSSTASACHSPSNGTSEAEKDAEEGETSNGATGDFECNICFDTAHDAVVSFCGHLFWYKNITVLYLLRVGCISIFRKKYRILVGKLNFPQENSTFFIAIKSAPKPY